MEQLVSDTSPDTSSECAPETFFDADDNDDGDGVCQVDKPRVTLFCPKVDHMLVILLVESCTVILGSKAAPSYISNHVLLIAGFKGVIIEIVLFR